MKTALLWKKVRTAGRVWRRDGWRGVSQVFLRRLSYPLLEARVRYFSPERPLRFPRHIQIEASSNCNLRCPSCSLSREVNPGRHLTPGDLQTLLDCLPFVPDAVSLNGIGEPLINPDFLELVDLLAARGIFCTFFTNGTLLTPRLRDAILARNNISYVGISCDGATKETFEVLRFGAKFETWKGFVCDFLAAAHARQPRPVETLMSSVVSRRNLSELDSIVALAAELGFRAITFADLVPNDPVSASMAISDAQWSALDTKQIIACGAQLGVEVNFNFRRTRIPPRGKLRCFQPWEYMMVSAEGDVLPCCAIIGSDKAQLMGNIFRQEFDQVWNGKEFQLFRKTSAEGSNSLCRRCPFY